MKKLIAVLYLLIAGPAVASDPGFYWGINYTQVDYKESGFPTVSPSAVVFKLGKEFSSIIAMEGRFGTGLSDDSMNISGVDLALDIDNVYGVYLKGMLPNKPLTPYGLIGVTKGKLTFTASVPGFSYSESHSDSGLSYGVGIDFHIGQNAAINLEYAQLLKGTGFKINGMSAGVMFRF
jgi:opacity protein-like surface antigen